MIASMDRRQFVTGSLAAAGLIGFAGMRSASAGSGGVLKFGLSSYPPSFKVWDQSGTAAGTVKLIIHRGLLGYDPQGKLRGELAEKWEVDDNGQWTFKLRDATFHDGRPVTSADVKWNIEQVASENSTAYFQGQFKAITKIETPDDKTVRLTTDKPIATLATWFAHYNMPIIPKGSEPDTTVGAGPFKLASRERGTSLTFAAYDKYYKKGLPKLSGIKAIVYSDENLRVAALQSGDIDLIEYVPWQSMKAIEDSNALKLETVDGPFMYLTFNGSRKPFDDPKVRRAIAHAVNRNDIVQAAFYGRGSALAHLPISKASDFYNADLADGWKYDPNTAKKLLAEAGHPNGFSCTLLSTAQYGMHQATAEVMQAYLSQIGIEVKLDLPDWSKRVELGNKGEYDIAVMGTTADSNDPDGLSNILDGTLPPSFARSYKLAVPEVDKALQEGRTTFGDDARRKIYHRMEAAAIESTPIVGLCWRSQGYAMKKEVQNFHNLPGQLTFYSGSSLEETSLG
jgi:peptide/nickel transport system substrate-binding protein